MPDGTRAAHTRTQNGRTVQVRATSIAPPSLTRTVGRIAAVGAFVGVAGFFAGGGFGLLAAGGVCGLMWGGSFLVTHPGTRRRLAGMVKRKAGRAATSWAQGRRARRSHAPAILARNDRGHGFNVTATTQTRRNQGAPWKTTLTRTIRHPMPTYKPWND